MNFLTEEKRTHYCGEVSKEEVGKDVVLMGWVDTRRDHGGLVFVDLRDRSGLVQAVLDPQVHDTVCAKDIRDEFVVAVKGVVRERPSGMENKKISTGSVEVEVKNCQILSSSKPLPIKIGDPQVSDNLRLKYRYLDLRAPNIQKNLILRHRFNQIVRQTLSDEGFYEVETPILYKSTPEGARDYLVPSRVHQGSFYALPQSPQTLKQLLMVSGFDRYFQIARCFRDEDLRADRQPEFTQIDMEMSFIDMEDVISINEKLVKKLWKELKGQEVESIPRMKYNEAMEKYGSDRPDTRFGMELVDLGEASKTIGFRVFEDILSSGGSVKGLVVNGKSDFSRGRFDKLTKSAKQYGAKGLVWAKWESDGAFNSSIHKVVGDKGIQTLMNAAGAKKGDALLIVADEFSTACTSLGAIRLELGEELNLIDKSKDQFLWVIDFPLFDYSPEEKRWVACHHPFTDPAEEWKESLVNYKDEEFSKMTAKAYDLVCNGHEIAGGSIRIFQSDVQEATFKALGMKESEVQDRFGFFIEALKYGTPPHGGIAWGVDRAVMILCETDAIREVIAFPKTTKAYCLMSDSPSSVDRDQLLELGIRLSASLKKGTEGEG